MIIAVTGNLGTGKSTVSKILAASLGAELLDSDQLCRQQLRPGSPGYAAFRKSFGDRYIDIDGGINRLLLKEAVFADPAVKETLENILHPLVKSKVSERMKVCEAAGKNLVVEVPLLFEVGWQGFFDLTVVVYMPVAGCVQRVMARDAMSLAEIERILSTQLPLAKKLEYADFAVNNSGNFVSTVQQVNWLVRRITNHTVTTAKTKATQLKSLTAGI